jgi:EAL domain-containing protein (putative c-di-GMP-specific phosphodiesterase class I)/GGDEF domain-containing protein
VLSLNSLRKLNMSLQKKLWLAITLLLLLVFSASFIATTLSARSFLEQQISIKNAESATALALSLGQQDTHKAPIELALSAQFDTGLYEMIEFRDPQGRPTVLRQDERGIQEAPGWFVALFPIRAGDGTATIHSSDQQAGTLRLRNHSRFAYGHLWQNTRILALICLSAWVVAGFIGGQLLQRILTPLDNIVEQAQAIGERRFIIAPAPDTLEFRKLVAAMNDMSNRVKQLLSQEARRLQKWQRDAHVDKVTGLNSRESFMNSVESALTSDDANATGSLGLVRLTGLARMNQTYGRSAVDAVLHEIGNELGRITMQHSGWTASRLNGSDFAVLAPRATDPADATKQARDAIIQTLEKNSMSGGVTLPAASTVYSHRDTAGKLMTRLDGALLANEREDAAMVSIAYDGDIQMQPVRQQMNQWRGILEQALHGDNFELERYPLLGPDRELIHYQGRARLHWDGQYYPAGHFLPWVNRLQLSSEFDMQVVDLALAAIESTGQPVAITISVGSVDESSFVSWIGERLTVNSSAAKQLWVEVPEAMAFRHLKNFKLLSRRIKSSGGKVGIGHAGHQLSRLGDLHDIGIDYLKVDAAFVLGVNSNTANQTLLRTLCTVGHSIGLEVYAEGVQTDDEFASLVEAGANGGTGPGVSLDP